MNKKNYMWIMYVLILVITINSASAQGMNLEGFVFLEDGITGAPNGVPIIIKNTRTGTTQLTEVYAPPIESYAGYYLINVYVNAINGDEITVTATHNGYTGTSSFIYGSHSGYLNITMNEVIPIDIGYTDAYENEFMAPQEFFAGSYITDNDQNLHRQYCPPDEEGHVDPTQTCYEQTGYREGSHRVEDWIWIETNITTYEQPYTVNWWNGNTWTQHEMNNNTDMNYLKLEGLGEEWQTFYITDNTSQMFLNWTKPSLYHPIGKTRKDESKYVAFNIAPSTINYQQFYMRPTPFMNTTSFNWCQSSPGGNLYDCMMSTYWGTEGMSPELVGTEYDRGQTFRGGIWNGDTYDTGVLQYTTPDNREDSYIQTQYGWTNSTEARLCFSFTLTYFNESIYAENNIENYYFRIWQEDQHYSSYLGIPQDVTWNYIGLFKWEYDPRTYVRDWKTQEDTKLFNEDITRVIQGTEVYGGFPKSLIVGYKDGFEFDVSEYSIYESGIQTDGQWNNYLTGKHHRSLVIFNLPDNATLQATDSNNDGISDYDALYTYYIDPFVDDTSEDGWTDAFLIANGYNPNDPTSHPGPTIQLLQPTNASTSQTVNITFQYNATTPSGIKQSTLRVYDVNNNLIRVTTKQHQNNETITDSFQETILYNVNITWNVEVEDQYGVTSTTENNTIQMDITLGCTDPEADNYNPEAEINDGSCFYGMTSIIITDIEDNIMYDYSLFVNGTEYTDDLGYTIIEAEGPTNITFTKTGWFNKTYNVNITENQYTLTGVHQATANFKAYNLNNEELTNYNITINGETKNNNETWKLLAGTHQAEFSKNTYNNQTQTIIIEPLSTQTYNFTGLYQQKTQITIKDGIQNTPINEFNIEHHNTNYTTTNGTIHLNTLKTDTIRIYNIENTEPITLENIEIQEEYEHKIIKNYYENEGAILKQTNTGETITNYNITLTNIDYNTLTADVTIQAPNYFSKTINNQDINIKGMFTAVGNNGQIRQSEDGKNWTTTGNAGTIQLNSIAWSPELGIFSAVGNIGSTRYSEYNKPWTTTGQSGSLIFTGITWSPELGIFSAVGYGNTKKWSEDGKTWNNVNNVNFDMFNDVTWSPELGLFVAVGVDGLVRWSEDGKTWATPITVAPSNLWSIEWSPELGLFVAVGGHGVTPEGLVIWSEDGKNWTTTHTTGNILLTSIAWSPELGIFSAVGFNGAVRWSENGKNWTTTGTAGSTTLRDIKWSPELGLFVAVGYNGAVRWSEDGKNWTTTGTAANTHLHSLAWSPEYYTINEELTQSYLDINIKEKYTLNNITNFNFTINQITYNEEDLPLEISSGEYNVTITTNNYLNKIETINIEPLTIYELNTTLHQVDLIITATDIKENTPINEFNIINRGTTYNTTNGTIHLNTLETETITITGLNNKYYNKTLTNHDVSSGNLEIQVDTKPLIKVYDIENNLLSNYNLTINEQEYTIIGNQTYYQEQLTETNTCTQTQANQENECGLNTGTYNKQTLFNDGDWDTYGTGNIGVNANYTIPPNTINAEYIIKYREASTGAEIKEITTQNINIENCQIINNQYQIHYEYTEPEEHPGNTETHKWYCEGDNNLLTITGYYLDSTCIGGCLSPRLYEEAMQWTTLNTYTITIQKTNYLPKTQEITLQENQEYNLIISQTEVMFEAYDIKNNELTNYNITINGETKNNTEFFDLLEGTYQAEFSKTGWYNETITIIVEPLTTIKHNFTELYQLQLELTARDTKENTMINNYTITYNNQDYTTTNGTIHLNALEYDTIQTKQLNQKYQEETYTLTNQETYETQINTKPLIKIYDIKNNQINEFTINTGTLQQTTTNGELYLNQTNEANITITAPTYYNQTETTQFYTLNQEYNYTGLYQVLVNVKANDVRGQPISDFQYNWKINNEYDDVFKEIVHEISHARISTAYGIGLTYTTTEENKNIKSIYFNQRISTTARQSRAYAIFTYEDGTTHSTASTPELTTSITDITTTIENPNPEKRINKIDIYHSISATTSTSTISNLGINKIYKSTQTTSPQHEILLGNYTFYLYQENTIPQEKNIIINTHGEQTITFTSVGYEATLNLIDEKTLEPFNMAPLEEMKLLIYCLRPDRTEEYEILNNQYQLNLTCEYEKIKFQLDYGDGLSYYRNIILPDGDIYNQTIYLIDANNTFFLYSSFGIDDLLGKYINPSIWIKKQVEDKTVTIQSDFTDIENKVGIYLIREAEYIIELHSDNQPMKTIGRYTADQPAAKTINMYDVSLTIDEPIGYYQNVIPIARQVNDSGTKSIQFNYQDPENKTTQLTFKLKNLDGQTIYESQTYESQTNIEILVAIPQAYENKTIISEILTIYDGEEKSITRYHNEDYKVKLGILNHINQGFLNWFLLIILSIIAIYSNVKTPGMGLAITLIAFAFVLFGWIQISLGLLVVAILISLVEFMAKQR